ncbi:MAG: MBG domain-containing protein, partial [Limnobacter sp.]
ANIDRRAVNVVAQAAQKTAGQDDPALAFTTEAANANRGLVAGESLAGELSRQAGEAAGAYAIEQGTVTDENNGNYTIAFTSANLTVVAAPVVTPVPEPTPTPVPTPTPEPIPTPTTPAVGVDISSPLQSTITVANQVPQTNVLPLSGDRPASDQADLLVAQSGDGPELFGLVGAPLQIAPAQVRVLNGGINTDAGNEDENNPNNTNN